MFEFCLLLEGQQALQVFDGAGTAFQLVFEGVDVPGVLFDQGLQGAYLFLALDGLLVLEAEVAADDAHVLLEGLELVVEDVLLLAYYLLRNLQLLLGQPLAHLQLLVGLYQEVVPPLRDIRRAGEMRDLV